MPPPLRQLGLDAGDRALSVLRFGLGHGSCAIAGEIDAIGAIDAGAVVSEITAVKAQGTPDLDRIEIRERDCNILMDADFERPAFVRVQPGKC